MSQERGVRAHLARPVAGPVRWWHVHSTIVLVVLAAIVFFVVGLLVGQHQSAGYYKQRYGYSVRVFKPPVRQQIAPIPQAASLPVAATLDLARYPAVGDQGTNGSCAAWAAAWTLSYEFRRATPTHQYIRFSPKWMYDHFTHGADSGSYVCGDLAVVSVEGVPRFKQYPYPPYKVNWPEPALDAYGKSLAKDAAAFRMTLSCTNGGYGYNGVAFAKGEVAQGYPAMIALPVYDSFFASKGIVDLPGPTEKDYGGHEIVIVAYDDTYKFPSGNVGGFLVQNQWGTGWGNKGRAWMSYAFVAQEAYALNGLRLSSGGPPPPPSLPTPAFPPHKTFPPPAGTPKHVTVTPQAGYLMKRGPYHDLINAAGRKYGVWPLGIAALVGTESSFNPKVSRCPNIYDCSAGLTQVAYLTAKAYNPFMVGWTVAQVFAWERVPKNAIFLTGRLLVDARRQSCERFAPLYAAYNQGWFLGCHAWQYHNPPAGYAAQAYTNYQGWLRSVMTNYS